MNERNKNWVFLILLLFVLWALLSVRWYTCGIKGFCGDGQVTERIENTILVDRSDERIIDGIELRPVEDLPETGTRTRTVEETERIVECPTYLNGFMKLGTTNTVSEVKKLQNFLNDYEGEDLGVDGLYQREDAEAVKRFQIKYREDILDPLGIKTATGNVFSSTRNHINAIHCAYNLED